MIRVDQTKQETIDDYKRLSNYDCEAAPNPKNMPSSFRPHCQLRGVFCADHDDFVGQADVLTFNLAAKSKELLWNSEFPVAGIWDWQFCFVWARRWQWAARHFQ